MKLIKTRKTVDLRSQEFLEVGEVGNLWKLEAAAMVEGDGGQCHNP